MEMNPLEKIPPNGRRVCQNDMKRLLDTILDIDNAYRYYEDENEHYCIHCGSSAEYCVDIHHRNGCVILFAQQLMKDLGLDYDR